MAIFTDPRQSRPRGSRTRRRVGWIVLLLAIVGVVAVGFVPAPYAIEQPGPVFNTLGTTQVKGGKTADVISVTGHAVYPTNGTLDALTVNVVGDPSSSPSWAQVVSAWFDPSKAVVPMDELYAPNETTQQSNQEALQEMSASQSDATAAALSQLGIHYTASISVQAVIKGSPSVGKLQAGDIIDSVDGVAPTSAAALHNQVVKNGTGTALTIVVTRGSAKKTVSLTPSVGPGSGGAPYVGIYLQEKYSFPFTVKIQLENVGGPSAGQMFALGVIDKLTPGELTGGKRIAGTGTIDATGAVGAIGGIRQKMYGARDAGATFFLAPSSNCNEVVGHVPSGLTVYSTSTLAQSLTDVKAIASGKGLGTLPTCTKS